MSNKLSRRKFVAGSLGAATLPALAKAAPTLFLPSSVKPIVVSSNNGFHYKNGGSQTCVELAYAMLTKGDDPLDAAIAGVNIVELDPTEMSVGYGGLPNADGVVQLDSCCMHGPKNWAGGVAAIEGVRTPSRVAKAVAESTDHHLLVGKGATEFARAMGFTIESDLNTEQSRKVWLEWKRRTDPEHYLTPEKREEVGHRALLSMIEDGLVDPNHCYGTINCNAMNEKGEICGVTTTSGLAFKIPGRVGDSPILGAGLYVGGNIGSAGSTGRGEANLFNLCSFLIVEELRKGAHPKDAGMAALKRVAENTVEKRLLDAKGQPNFGLQFYVLDRQGRHAGVSLNTKVTYAVCDDLGPRNEPCEVLFD